MREIVDETRKMILEYARICRYAYLRIVTVCSGMWKVE